MITVFENGDDAEPTTCVYCARPEVEPGLRLCERCKEDEDAVSAKLKRHAAFEDACDERYQQRKEER